MNPQPPLTDRLRVLLLWPGSLFERGHNFGVPSMLALASAVRAADADAIIDVIDLDFEVAFGNIDLASLVAGGYDLVGVSCYSSFDYLKTMEIARAVRRHLPKACLVVGGYHASARPDDFCHDDSPFDFVARGDGEETMAALTRAVLNGRPPADRVLCAAPTHPGRLGSRYDFSLLNRYRPFARKIASQAEISLARGCPYTCSFCMERAKGEHAWRALEPEAALDELHRLDAFLDLSTWTVFVSDALFGLKTSWRRTFLEGLASRPVRARKIWVLARQDLLEREDLVLMARANVAPGFGLESGDAEMLSLIQKGSDAQAYLDHLLLVAAWAKELDLPWGANVIVGHPGETEASLRRSADYLRKLFLAKDGTTGFVSVDAFRLYPGSPIDLERGEWERRTGMFAHRYPWWHDGDQAFLAEWIDPSRELDFRSCQRLTRELFAPIVRAVRDHFSYAGPARDYFLRAAESQLRLDSSKAVVQKLGLWHLWTALLDEHADPRLALEHDAELRAAARDARMAAIRGKAEGIYEQAIVAVERERFVPLEAVAQSSDDIAMALTEDGLSTISAMHAYARSFEALELGAGDSMVDLGGGTGYGTAVAAHIVGPTGQVTCIEIVDELVERARENLAGRSNVTVIRGDAHDTLAWQGATKVSVGFEVRALPEAWLQALAPGGKLVAPVGGVLTRICKDADGRTTAQQLGPVRYVGDRAAGTAAGARTAPSPPRSEHG